MDVRLDLHETGPPEGGMFGEPPTLVSESALCKDCDQVHEFEVCPRCGADIMHGFGLGFGPGLGVYKVCELFCGWQYKEVLPQDEC